MNDTIHFVIGAWFGGDVVMFASVWLAYKLNPELAETLTTPAARLRFALAVLVWPFGLYGILQFYKNAMNPPPPFRPVELDDEDDEDDDDEPS